MVTETVLVNLITSYKIKAGQHLQPNDNVDFDIEGDLAVLIKTTRNSGMTYLEPDPEKTDYAIINILHYQQ